MKRIFIMTSALVALSTAWALATPGGCNVAGPGELHEKVHITGETGTYCIMGEKTYVPSLDKATRCYLQERNTNDDPFWVKLDDLSFPGEKC